MKRDAAIAHLRQALGKGPDAALAAAAHIMEYGVGRSCTYAELRSACARASAAGEAAPAWITAREQADQAKRELARFAKPPPAGCPCGGAEGRSCLFCSLPVTDPDSTLEYWLAAVDQGFQGRFPWAPLVRWYLDTQPPRIHERAATVSTTGGEIDMTRRPRLASQVLTGRWDASVQAGSIDGVLVAAKTQVPRTELQVCRPAAAPEGGALGPLPPRDERLVMLAAFDRRNPVLRGDTSLLLDIAHMADFPVRGKVREWAALLARTRDGGFRWPQACDFRRVWDAALAARCMHVRERDAAGKLTGRWAPLAHVDADWGASRPADPDRDELIIGPSQWLREAMRSTGGWTLTAAGGDRGKNRITVGEQSMAGLLVTALEYFLAGYYDGAGGTGRYLQPPRAGGPGPVAELPWPVVMYLVGDAAEVTSDAQRNAAWMRFNRAVTRLKERGYFLPASAANAGAPAGDSVELVSCSGRPARVRFRASDWFCAAAQQVAKRPDGFTQVPLADYLRRREWRVATPRTDGDPHA